MSPLHLSSAAASVPSDAKSLVQLLQHRPQPAVIWYGSEGERVELSGTVLANWAVKLIGLLAEEYDLSEGDAVVVDMGPHWKAAAAALAAVASGALTSLGAGKEGLPVEGGTTVVISEQPLHWVESGALGDAELAAVSAGMLDSSFEDATGTPLPDWVVDISAEVRQQPDQLLVPLPDVELARAGSPPGEPVELPTPAEPVVITAWSTDSLGKLLGAWAHSQPVIFFNGSPQGAFWKTMLRNEGLG